MILVGLSGKQRVGKDTVASYLQLKYNFIRLANADYLKHVSKKVGWDGKKDSRGRRLLQQLGVIVRDYDKNFWVGRVAQQVNELKEKDEGVHIVVTDIRFVNEADLIRSLGGRTIRIERDTGIEDAHISETELDAYKFDDVIANNGSYDQLYTFVDDLFSRVLLA